MRRTTFCLSLLIGLALLGVSSARAAENEKAKATIPIFRLSGDVTESPADEMFSFGAAGVSLKDLVARLRKAEKDAAVKAVVLQLEGGGVGQAQIEELRQAVSRLQAANKPVYAHSDSLDMGDYVLLSGASRLSVAPTADLWVTGLHGEAMYLRGLLDLVGVRPDFLTCGDYKSAAEMFMREGPSPEAEKMQNWLLDSIYETDVRLIAEGRKVDAAKVKSWIDNGPYTAEKAKAAGLIDAVEHRQDFLAMLKEKHGNDVLLDKKYGKKAPPKLDFSSPLAVFNIWGELMGAGKKKSTKDAIGIVYVDGAIDLGSGGASPFGVGGAMSSSIRKALDEAAADDSIKAVVLRVDSPGGSAVASEIILGATRRVKAKKPFVVSMGNVAGSGGYYVACASDVIFADANTITGSIGVVGGKLATSAMWKKVGVSFKTYNRGQNAGLLGSGDVFTKDERAKMQAWMDDIYGVFKGHVVKVRGDRLKKPIDELAGGRVYTGKQALELGLVDKLGTLQDALDHVAKEAKLTEYEVRAVPEPKNFLDELLKELSGEEDESSRFGLFTRLAGLRLGGEQLSLVDLALPHLRGLDPARVKAVTSALRNLQLLQREGAVLLMPEIGVR